MSQWMSCLISVAAGCLLGIPVLACVGASTATSSRGESDTSCCRETGLPSPPKVEPEFGDGAHQHQRSAHKPQPIHGTLRRIVSYSGSPLFVLSHNFVLDAR